MKQKQVLLQMTGERFKASFVRGFFQCRKCSATLQLVSRDGTDLERQKNTAAITEFAGEHLVKCHGVVFAESKKKTAESREWKS